MNEITRIHIAKTPYDIEVGAKKELESYIHKLEVYAEDGDWLQDIEIRITELLNERGVAANGIISADDVTALREQLGDPQEFLEEGDIAVGVDIEKTQGRRLYRDLDTAILGGVLGGIAKYVGMNPAWPRIAFIILLFISFGTAAVVYLVLWLVVPPARTVAEKLQLTGKPVTLASIKELRSRIEANGEVNRVAKVVQNVIIYGLGTLLAIGAVIALVTTIWGGIALVNDTNAAAPLVGFTLTNGLAWMIYSLFVVSGLLLTALLSVAAAALFKKKMTKRIAVTMVAIIVAGVATFSAGMGTLVYGGWQESNRINDSRFTKNVTLPQEAKNMKNLILDLGEYETGMSPTAFAYVEYIVTDGTPRYEIELDSTIKQVKPIFNFSQDGLTGTMTVAGLRVKENMPYTSQALLKVYGPALETVKTRAGALVYTNTKGQDSLSATAQAGTLDIKGAYTNLTATTRDNNSSLTLSSASIENLNAVLEGGHLDAAVVRTLTVTQSDVCAASDYYGDRQNRLVVEAVTSDKLTFNGEEQSARTVTHPCGEVIIGDESEYLEDSES